MTKEGIDLDKIIFSVEPLHKVKSEILPLAKQHWAEVEWMKQEEISPNWDKYEMIEAGGGLIIFTAREESVLIGYNVFFLHDSLHYQNQKCAVQDLIYIHPEKRGFGKLFVHWSDEQLKLLGVNFVSYHLKADNDYSEKVLLPLGYQLIDKVYGRKL